MVPGRQVPVMAREGGRDPHTAGTRTEDAARLRGRAGHRGAGKRRRGGIEGPSGVYEELAERLGADGVTVLRPDYRRPNDLAECTRDVLAALDTLGAERAVLGLLLDEGGAQSYRWDEAPLPVQSP